MQCLCLRPDRLGGGAVSGLGMWTCGRDARAAFISGDIYHHTIAVMEAAQSTGDYASLAERDAFEAEYWPLELYKLTLQPPERLLARQVALVTGAASGIGCAIARRFATEGAHVVVADIDGRGAEAVAAEIAADAGPERAIGVALDVTDERQVSRAFDQIRLAYGGLDILVSNAGIAPSGSLAAMDARTWEKSLAVNTTGHFLVTREAIRLLKAQGTGGSLILSPRRTSLLQALILAPIAPQKPPRLSSRELQPSRAEPTASAPTSSIPTRSRDRGCSTPICALDGRPHTEWRWTTSRSSIGSATF